MPSHIAYWAAFAVLEASSVLTALEEWDLTSDLPKVDANTGFEGITWVPDSFLTSKRFYDQMHGKIYNPTDYPGHGNGVFFLGLEGNGYIYSYVLLSNGVYHQLSSSYSGESTIMSVEFDYATGYLWAGCDNHCNGRSNVLSITSSDSSFPSISGASFQVVATYARPSAMGNYNTEGFAIASSSQYCTVEAGKQAMKAVYWSDDDNTNEHALRMGTLPCEESFLAAPFFNRI
jgi:hypothetical protein